MYGMRKVMRKLEAEFEEFCKTPGFEDSGKYDLFVSFNLLKVKSILMIRENC